MMVLTMLLFGLFALTTLSGVAIARAGNDTVHANSSTVGVLACVLALSAATLLVATMGGPFAG